MHENIQKQQLISVYFETHPRPLSLTKVKKREALYPPLYDECQREGDTGGESQIIDAVDPPSIPP